jgi:hypothetical protein
MQITMLASHILTILTSSHLVGEEEAGHAHPTDGRRTSFSHATRAALAKIILIKSSLIDEAPTVDLSETAGASNNELHDAARPSGVASTCAMPTR